MPGTSDQKTLEPGLPAFPHAVSAQPAPPDCPAAAEHRMADAARALARDAAETCSFTHAMADVATSLWSRTLRFDATDPTWPDRDRVVLSAGHGAMLLYALLNLTGHTGLDEPALRRFAQLDSPAAGHPEHGGHPAIEATTGPLGQGLATAVGMALAERVLAARFGRSLVDHRTWVLAAAEELKPGISHEAACLAGELRLEKLTVLFEARSQPVQESSSDILKRFAASGWATKRIDANDPAAIAAALVQATRSRKPTLLACHTRPEPHSREWDHAPFDTPHDVAERWARAGIRGTPARRAWLKRLNNHPLRAEFERQVAGRLPETWHEATAALKADLLEARPDAPTSDTSLRTLATLAAAIPELVAGSSLGEPHMSQPGPTLPGLGVPSLTANDYAGRFVCCGARENGMAACLNGIALHAGLLPIAAATLVQTDAMRPALRLAALMRQRVIHALTDDGIGIGQSGPTMQPVEHLASFRAMPGIHLMRPADAIETVECWELALRRADGPSLIVLSRQPVPTLRTDAAENRSARGGYVLAEADGPRQATLIASGSEVALALEARRLLAADGVPAAVVSLPCWGLFAAQDESVRNQVLGTALRVGVEAACGFGWDRWLGPDGIFIGMSGFGASAPADILYQHFGITPEAIATAVRKPAAASTTPEGPPTS